MKKKTKKSLNLERFLIDRSPKWQMILAIVNLKADSESETLIYYSSIIVTIGLSCFVSEIFTRETERPVDGRTTRIVTIQLALTLGRTS